MNQLQIHKKIEQTPIEVALQIGDDGTITARRVYEFLQLNTAHYARWCKANIAENEFAEKNVDWWAFTINGEWGGQATIDYKLTVAFAKKLCMKAGGIRGEQARDYFVKVEGAYRETMLAINSLSPQLQLLIQLEREQAELKAQLAVTSEKVDAAAATITTIKDTIIKRDADWREWCNKSFIDAVTNSPDKDYQSLRRDTYEALERRAECDLNRRLRNMKQRLLESGATKSKIDGANRLDVIEADTRLKEIYTTIIKELAIKYSA